MDYSNAGIKMVNWSTKPILRMVKRIDYVSIGRKMANYVAKPNGPIGLAVTIK